MGSFAFLTGAGRLEYKQGKAGEMEGCEGREGVFPASTDSTVPGARCGAALTALLGFRPLSLPFVPSAHI